MAIIGLLMLSGCEFGITPLQNDIDVILALEYNGYMPKQLTETTEGYAPLPSGTSRIDFINSNGALDKYGYIILEEQEDCISNLEYNVDLSPFITWYTPHQISYQEDIEDFMSSKYRFCSRNKNKISLVGVPTIQKEYITFIYEALE